jgi:hypothetical protein
MKLFKGLLATAAAAAMLTGTTAAAAAAAPAANPAASLSLAGPARAGSPANHGNRLGAEISTTTLISIGILAALVVIVLVATDGGDDSPNSP